MSVIFFKTKANMSERKRDTEGKRSLTDTQRRDGGGRTRQRRGREHSEERRRRRKPIDEGWLSGASASSGRADGSSVESSVH